ncbi:hypothetical protein Smp_082500 [Schistosoma mansoni]|uniref:hypothetical protein n=1 Tax=Schistosoma mansoni TaxID=6183 RepID=UPI00019B37E3|nr:hypothetical protein Smp_082500 [Schistosoma mansoni]|eukprot:XP_018650727.1 hypothetical protein Smp_082500 [Schistosoma mansoni]
MTMKARPPGFDHRDPYLSFAQLGYYFTRHNIKYEVIDCRSLCSIYTSSFAKEVLIVHRIMERGSPKRPRTINHIK